jgi:hypothetical protein
MDSLKNSRRSQLDGKVGGVVGWGIAALIISVIVLTFNTSPLVLGAGFFAKAFGIVLGTVLGTLGALLGDALRRFVMPSFTFTSGGFFSLLLIRIFWLVGPQMIGLLLGAIFGVSLPLMSR